MPKEQDDHLPSRSMRADCSPFSSGAQGRELRCTDVESWKRRNQSRLQGTVQESMSFWSPECEGTSTGQIDRFCTTEAQAWRRCIPGSLVQRHRAIEAFRKL